MGASCQLSTGMLDASSTLTLARPHARPRRGRLLLLITAMALVGLTLVGRNLLEKHIRQQILPSLSQRFGRSIEVGQIRFGLGTATLRDLRVGGPSDGADGPLVRVDRAKVSVNLGALLHGEIQVEQISMAGVRAHVFRGEDGMDNVSDLGNLLLKRSGASATSTSGGEIGRLRLSRASLHATDVELNLIDERSGGSLVLLADELHLDKELGANISGATLSTSLLIHGHQASFELESADVQLRPDGQIKVSADQVQSGTADPLLHGLLAKSAARSIYLERVRGPDGQWQVNLLGELARLSRDSETKSRDESMESFLLSATLPKAGGLKVRASAENIQLSRLTPLLKRFPQLQVKGSAISGAWTILGTREEVVVQGDAEFSGVAFQHARIAKESVRLGKIHVSGQASFDFVRGEFRVPTATVISGEVPYEVSLEMLLPGYERPAHPDKKLSVSLHMPEVTCQQMLASLPKGLAPQLSSFVVEGNAMGDLSLMIDWSDFELTELGTNVNLDACHVVSAPEHMSRARLNGSFTHSVPVPGGTRTFVVGPQNPDFVALGKVSQNLKRSFLTTEDSAFYRHDGFITKEFRGALVKNLKRGRFAYGASSISMQVVKNVLLSREKTVSRKLQELFLTWHIERSLSKDRILEIYVNAIEFGPGLYGIKPAARQYFAKHPRSLNPVESAFLSSLLPAPSKRYKQYCGGRLRRSTSKKIERILGFMHKRHRLDEEQYAEALETPLSFRGRRSALCKPSKPQQEGHTS